MSSVSTVMILSFQTDRSRQTVQTQIRVYTVCYSICIVWMHFSMKNPYESNFRIITVYFSGVRIFRSFMVDIEMRKPVFETRLDSKLARVFDILDVESVGIVLSMERITDVQADLRLCCSHMAKTGFLTTWLKCL